MDQTHHLLLPAERTAVAPDGSDVRVLLGVAGGGMAHFQLKPGKYQRPSPIETSRNSGMSLAATEKCGSNTIRRAPRRPSAFSRECVYRYPLEHDFSSDQPVTNR